MVEIHDAVIAVATMRRPGRSMYVAGGTVFNSQVVTSDGEIDILHFAD